MSAVDAFQIRNHPAGYPSKCHRLTGKYIKLMAIKYESAPISAGSLSLGTKTAFVDSIDV